MIIIVYYIIIPHVGNTMLCPQVSSPVADSLLSVSNPLHDSAASHWTTCLVLTSQYTIDQLNRVMK